MPTKGSLAAKKANETRGQNGRHTAAIKASETRKKNEQTQKHREAALKAWETRRTNTEDQNILSEEFKNFIDELWEAKDKFKNKDYDWHYSKMPTKGFPLRLNAMVDEIKSSIVKCKTKEQIRELFKEYETNLAEFSELFLMI